ncbi:MAG TPA: serine hydrolase, partial [Puia sp.]|nr:serine hydrolase [Puia sp.]
EHDYSGQTAVYNDPTAADGKPSVANYIKKIFLVSDNDAFNRLYEFLGQEYINDRLHKMGYADAQILHRLSIPLSDDENRHTNPIGFYDATGKLLYKQPMQTSQLKYAHRNDSLGIGYYDNDGRFVNQPMNFSEKNRICLTDLHNILRAILFPNSVPVNQRFNLSNEDYQFVYQYLSQYPPETNYPPYDSAHYWDGYGKLLYWGSQKATLPKNIRIFNKEGDAYGFLTDISYFVDFDKKIEFMLSATIYCNSDGVLNDDKYDYETLGMPFMKQLGRVIYESELGRNRNYAPNLYGFKIKYDK